MKMNNIESVNDLILYNWLKFASDGLRDIENTTEYDALKTMVKNIYSTSYVPAITNYFDYTYNKTISPLPERINGGMIEEYHNEFRRLAMKFNMALNDSLFNRFTFEESPYSKAVLLDGDNQELKVNEKFEVYDEAGNLIDNTGVYRVFIPIDSIKGNNDNINLPDDAIIINDLTYVLDSHINEYK